MKVVKYIFATLFALILIIAALLALVLHNVEATVFSPSNYKTILAEQGFYKELPAFLATQMAAATTKGGASKSDPFQGVSETELAGGLDTMVTQAGFRNIAEDAIDRIFAFVDGKAKSIAIPLTTLKTLPSMMRWIGVPLLLAGLIGIAISKVSGSLAISAIKEQIAGTHMSASTTDLMNKVGEAAAQSLVSPIFMQAILLALVGIGLIVGAFFVAKKAEPAASDQPATAQ